MSWVDKLVKGKVPYKFDEIVSLRKKKKTYYLCPECGSKLTTHCLCPKVDAVCENEHKWHLEYDATTKKYFVRKGHSDHL